jgi:hypothetical protein
VPEANSSLVHYVLAAIGMHVAGQWTTGGATRTSHEARPSCISRPPNVRVVRHIRNTPPTRATQIGRLVVILAAALQCSATLVLGIRRELRGAATPMDRRTFMFVACGLVILLQTAIVQALPRVYRRNRDTYHTAYSWTIVMEALHYVFSFLLYVVTLEMER